MTREAVVVDGRPLTINTLEPRARGELVQAIVVARLRDGVTGAPARGRTRVSGSVPGLSQRTTSYGFAGLVGTPSRVVPGLATQGYSLLVTFEVDGYATRTELVAIPQDLTFPSTFAAVELGDLDLHRLPVRVEVQAYELDTANDPVELPGATVIVDLVSDRLGQPMAAAPLLGTTVGLSGPRPLGSSVRATALTMPAEPDRRLITGVPAGSDRLEVDNVGALAVGDLVGVDLAVPEWAERVEVTAISGPVDLLSPAIVTLSHPLQNAHRAGGLIRRIVASPPGATLCTLTRDALAGDRSLGVDSVALAGAGQVARLDGGAAPPEYRTLELFRATTDSDGIARLPRQAACPLSASAPAPAR